MSEADRSAAHDSELGLTRNIPRRDFLNGLAISVGGAFASDLLPTLAQAAQRFPQDVPGYNPPALTGMRGSAPGSYENAHALRDGSFWLHAGAIVDAGEHYDLVVVGSGISGLAAAYFLSQAAPHGAYSNSR